MYDETMNLLREKTVGLVRRLQLGQEPGRGVRELRQRDGVCVTRP